MSDHQHTTSESHHQHGVTETEIASNLHPTHPAPSAHATLTVHPEKSHRREDREDRLAELSGSILERGDTVIYAIVGICFFLGALFGLGYSFWDFGSAMFQPHLSPPIVATAIIKLVSDLLLVLIIMEVLGTVIHYLKSHATTLRPFLFIGIVSATRGILSIGAKLSVESGVQQQDFVNAMIELGVSAAVILALGITLKLLGKFVEGFE